MVSRSCNTASHPHSAWVSRSCNLHPIHIARVFYSCISHSTHIARVSHSCNTASHPYSVGSKFEPMSVYCSIFERTRLLEGRRFSWAEGAAGCGGDEGFRGQRALPTAEGAKVFVGRGRRRLRKGRSAPQFFELIFSNFSLQIIVRKRYRHPFRMPISFVCLLKQLYARQSKYLSAEAAVYPSKQINSSPFWVRSRPADACKRGRVREPLLPAW